MSRFSQTTYRQWLAIAFVSPFLLSGSSLFASPNVGTDIRIPLDAELERYMLAAEKFLQEKDFAQAHRYLERAQNLDLELPARFFFFQGRVHHSKKQWAKAQTNYEEYILRSNSEGTYYQKSLEMMTELENTAPSKGDEKLIKQEISWESRAQSTDNSGYIDKIKTLYIETSAKQALITHINTLLASTPFTGQKIISSKAGSNALEMSVSLTSDNKIAVQKTQNQGDSSQIMSFSASVFGLSRDFLTKCDPSSVKCSIKHKDTLNTWFEIGHDPSVAKEIAEAASALVLTLQTEAQDPTID